MENFARRKSSTSAICIQAILFLSLLLSCFLADAKKSPRDNHEGERETSTVAGVTIRNFHLLSEGEGRIYRGAQPASREDEAAAIGVNRVVIYKKQNKNEVDREIQNWQQLGLKSKDILHLPATWNNVNVVQACEQAITALQWMKTALETKGAALYLHCTAGEDRTALVSGTFRLLHDKWTVDQTFRDEMCGRGYEAGSPTKPGMVVREVRKGLTPLFLKFAALQKSGKLSWDKIDLAVCEDIENVIPIDEPKNWICQ